MKKRTMAELENAKGFVKGFEALLEVIALTVVYYIFWRKGYTGEEFPDYYFKGKYVLAGVYAVLTLLLYKNADGFAFGNLRKFALCMAQGLSMLMVNTITYFQLCLIANVMVSPVPMLMLTVVQVVMILFFVFFYTKLYYRIYAPHTMLMIYGSDEAVTLKFKMDSRKDKYRINKLINVDVGLEQVCREIQNYDCVVINDVPAEIRNDILKFCYRHKVRTYVVPKISDILMRGACPISVMDTPIVMVKGTGLSLVERFLKRTMDILVCLVAMIPAAPVMAIVALAIKLEDGGPVFYKQRRVTLNDQEFEVLKFRSMIVDAEKKTGAVLAAGNDNRITKIGHFIRATRLDEIPQILNILKGDMSLVGPRPERKVFIDEFCEKIPEFSFRTKVKAGLTGYAQIYGKYNTTPYDKLRLDLMYIENYSILLDIKLILLTIRIIFSKDSTEGIDVAKENEAKTRALLKKLREKESQAETMDDKISV